MNVAAPAGWACVAPNVRTAHTRAEIHRERVRRGGRMSLFGRCPVLSTIFCLPLNISLRDVQIRGQSDHLDPLRTAIPKIRVKHQAPQRSLTLATLPPRVKFAVRSKRRKPTAVIAI